ncbi:carboxylesterase/lipase family protein [Bradyrhizobium sp. GCM10027634]|uniref:carboxylesterase/lipase family protein n=1 Tax=unclassified Bradyrhizobium TaxID=2631580 RepID=UPI00188DB265|nr:MULTISPECIES: carboxylesterase family protein [unclassified Bradyrhizobium]MDN5003798.1 carboxylesterase family protein [Bradyrhizobium sp. WYCCWR 12677]
MAIFAATVQGKVTRARHTGAGFLIGLLGVFAVAATDAAADSPTHIIVTTNGQIRGVSDGVVNRFQGIRYANSTAGANRWTVPTAPARVHTIFDATTPGSACPQPGGQFSAQQPSSEDCLFLNITTPVHSEGEDGLPVWIFLHGGGLVTGAGAQYDPSLMVSTHKIIVVTINYRLGALGWLAHPALDGNGVAGNYGLMDQQFAFKWVRDNIEHFGGDPHRVTIGGQSAGGGSTSSHLASPLAQGLFQAAIIESGAYALHTIPSVAAQEASGIAFATKLNCTGVNSQIAACLRNAPLAALLASQGILQTGGLLLPTAGTTILPQGWAEAFGSGSFNRVPVIQGTTLNEGTLFEPFYFDPAFTFVPGGRAQSLVDRGIRPFAFFVGIISATSADPFKVSTLAALYPPANFPNPDNNNLPSADQALGQIYGDINYSCPALHSNELLARFVPVYAYEFADPDAPNVFLPLIGFSYGASHASELQYLFDANTIQSPADAAANAASPAPGANVQPPPLTSGGQQLAAEMKSYWANFVRFHDPNGRSEGGEEHGRTHNRDLAYWPRFGEKGPVQKLVPGPARPFAITNLSSRHNCDALTNLGLIR